MSAPSQGVTADAPLHEKEIKADAGENDEEHHGRDRRAHRRIAELQLVAEEGAVEERAENVGREIGPRERALDRIDQIEGVEIGNEGQHRDQADRRQDEWKFYVEENAEMPEPVDARRIDQHHRNADELPDRNEGQGYERARFQAEPRSEQGTQPYGLQGARGYAPQRGEDQVPGESNDDNREHRRQEHDGAIETLKLQARQAQQSCERDADRVLHAHVHGEEDQIVA